MLVYPRASFFKTELFVKAWVCSPTVLRQLLPLRSRAADIWGKSSFFLFPPYHAWIDLGPKEERGRRKGKIEFLAKMSGGNELLPPPPPSLSAKKQRHFFHAASFKAKGGKTGLYHSCMLGMIFFRRGENVWERVSMSGTLRHMSFQFSCIFAKKISSRLGREGQQLFFSMWGRGVCPGGLNWRNTEIVFEN